MICEYWYMYLSKVYKYNAVNSTFYVFLIKPTEIQEYKPSHLWQLLLLFVMQILDQTYVFL